MKVLVLFALFSILPACAFSGGFSAQEAEFLVDYLQKTYPTKKAGSDRRASDLNAAKSSDVQQSRTKLGEMRPAKQNRSPAQSSLDQLPPQKSL